MAITTAARVRTAINRTLRARLSATSSLVDKLTGSYEPGPASPLPPSPVSPLPTPVVLDLSDTRRLFASVPTSALIRSLATLSAVASGPLVELGTGVMNYASASAEGGLIHSVAFAAARATVHRHFCAGESVEDAADVVRAMWTATGLRSTLDYGMEDALDGAACDRNLNGFLRVVEMASTLPPTTARVCVKVTALSPISLLEKVSDLLRWEQKTPSFRLPWRMNSFPVLCGTSPLYLTPTAPPPLTNEEESELMAALQRLFIICKRCKQSNIPILIDAEYSTVQPAIDYFTYAATLQYNDDVDHPIVYGTLQTYLTDSEERMVNAFGAAEKAGVLLGFKLVRGAYMVREGKLAASLGFPSPIHGSIQDTHRCFNNCTAFTLEKVNKGFGAVVIATHNVESGQIAASKVDELGMRRNNQKLQFAQLMGMADGLSLGLSNLGFQVSKYMPFGPVEQVLPYLLRRAEENRALLSASVADRQLMRKELWRRLIATLLGRA